MPPSISVSGTWFCQNQNLMLMNLECLLKPGVNLLKAGCCKRVHSTLWAVPHSANLRTQRRRDRFRAGVSGSRVLLDIASVCWTLGHMCEMPRLFQAPGDLFVCH